MLSVSTFMSVELNVHTLITLIKYILQVFHSNKVDDSSRVEHIYVHPKYVTKIYKSDISLLKVRPYYIIAI